MKVIYHETEASMSSLDSAPSDAAELRAAEHPVPGDRWTEMSCAWYHVDKVEEYVLVRLYIGPCEIKPENAKEEFHVYCQEFPTWIRRRAEFIGNSDWARQIGTNSGPRSPFENL